MPYSDSVTMTAELDLYPGVWLHDPLDPVGTLWRFEYGRSQRSSTVDVLGQGTLYAGREFPVVDFGEHTAEKASVVIDIPNGVDASADLAALDDFVRGKRTLYFRDNRGRGFHCTVGGYQRQDAHWGAAISFDAVRTHYAVTEVA